MSLWLPRLVIWFRADKLLLLIPDVCCLLTEEFLQSCNHCTDLLLRFCNSILNKHTHIYIIIIFYFFYKRSASTTQTRFQSFRSTQNLLTVTQLLCISCIQSISHQHFTTDQVRVQVLIRSPPSFSTGHPDSYTFFTNRDVELEVKVISNIRSNSYW